MECEVCSESLTALADGELSAGERKEVENHLGICARCREEHESLLASFRLTEHLPEMELNPHLWEHVLAQIAALPEPRPRALRRIWPLPLRWAPVAGTLGIIIVSVGLFWSYSLQREALEERLQSYVTERERIEQQHLSFFGRDPGGTLDPIYSNPFADHDHEAEQNPFTLD